MDSVLKSTKNSPERLTVFLSLFLYFSLSLLLVLFGSDFKKKKDIFLLHMLGNDLTTKIFRRSFIL